MQELLKKIDEQHAKLAVHRPFEGHFLPLIKGYYRVGQTYTSNAIEGFSYTETETKILLEDGLTAGGKPLRDMYAVLGHAKAYDYMYELLGNQSITENDVLIFHSMLAGALDNDASPGQYRNKQVFITGSDYAFMPPEQVPEAMKKLFEQSQEKIDALHPVEFAAFIHKEIATIHPFEDGNGRVVRLAMNTVLIQKGYLPAIIPPVIRHEYISAIEKTHFDKDREFNKFIAECEYETLKSMIRMMEGASREKNVAESWCPLSHDTKKETDSAELPKKENKHPRMR